MLYLGELIHNGLGKLQHLSERRNCARHTVIALQARNIGGNHFHEFFDIVIRFGSGRQSYLHFDRNRVALLVREIETGI
jgi:hypothetical protein